MSYQKQDLINYRLDKSATTYQEAEFLFQNGFFGEDPGIVVFDMP